MCLACVLMRAQASGMEIDMTRTWARIVRGEWLFAVEQDSTEETQLRQQSGGEHPGEPREPPAELLAQGVNACLEPVT